jgi:uncharacterized protein involved in response to NO
MSDDMKTLFSMGFRPFFIAASLYAVFALVEWVLMYAGHRLPRAWDDGMAWHAHEMIFGFVAAVIGGFLLTAVPNWTKSQPVHGRPLAALLCVWLAGRVVMHLGATMSWPLLAAVDMLFLPALALSLLPSVVQGRSVRNYVFFGILGVLTLLNGVIHAGVHGAVLWLDPGAALQAAVFLVVLMIVILGGRVIPLFTRNALKLSGADVEMKVLPSLERASTASVAFLAALSLGGFGENSLTGWVSILAGILLSVRMAGWYGQRTFAMPIVWILHVAYGWIVLGLLEYGSAVLFRPSLALVALHVLTIGGIGTMTIGMMSRVSLGHTGRPLRAPDTVVAAYVILQLAVLARVAGGLDLADYATAVAASGVLWSVAFGLFALAYLPMLLRPRIDERVTMRAHPS